MELVQELGLEVADNVVVYGQADDNVDRAL